MATYDNNNPADTAERVPEVTVLWRLRRVAAFDGRAYEGTGRLIGVYDSREEAIREMIRTAHEEARLTPNNPIVVQTGADELSICVGVYSLYRFKVDEIVA